MTYLLTPSADDAEPGIHILLVGVTDYFHLPGGKGKQFVPADGFPPLDAPDHSCRELGQWLLEGNLTHPTLPIKSIDALASKVRFTSSNGTSARIDPPTYENVSAAIDRWHALGELSADNLLIFYFCGHGLHDGASTHSLLCADFGARENAPFENAIHYEGFESGMRACRARQQVFILDMCRTAEPRISRGFKGPGNSVVDRRPPEDLAEVSQSVIWATSGGAEAWSKSKMASVFAKAFMKCFDGAAATFDNHSPAIVANASSIRAATWAWIEVFGEAMQEPQHSQPTGRQFVIHKFTNVKVPVVVRCLPDHLTGEADMSCWQNARRLRRSTSSARQAPYWQVDLPRGTYRFRASFQSGIEVETEDALVYPPLTPVFINTA